MNTREKGRYGEDIAMEYLLSKGYTILSRNFQARSGEIDCVAQSPDNTLVFVEVKASRTSTAGHPFSWVTPLKQRKISRMARKYLADHGLAQRACRFDVIAVVNGKVDHLKNAFFAC
jgi:putative endonuclease